LRAVFLSWEYWPPGRRIQVFPDGGLRGLAAVPFWDYFPGADSWGPRELLIAGDLL
jgi:hypothetical protein